ncbi:MAG: transglutaminase family protein [Verrucomicrobiota bacterium]
MKLQIEHVTRYEYDQSVTFTPHLLLILPRQDVHIRTLVSDLNVFPHGSLHYGHDHYGNNIARYFSTEESAQLLIQNHLTVESTRSNPYDFLLDPHVTSYPFEYKENEKRALSPFLTCDESADLFSAWLGPIPEKRETLEFLTHINQRLHSELGYVRRDEPGVQTVSETLETGSASCRDVAHLFMELARHLGLASRFVSGYLYVSKTDEESAGVNVAEHAMHAWTEIYLPGSGWLGFDPTNGCLAGDQHIPVAAAITAADASPIQGTYCSDHQVGCIMHVDVQIKGMN